MSDQWQPKNQTTQNCIIHLLPLAINPWIAVAILFIPCAIG